jgi:peptidyl-prolyl cis-trans isomerase B (cyclophilin B)
MGGPGFTIRGEFLANGVKNTLRHTRGVLSNGAYPGAQLRRLAVFHQTGRRPALGRPVRGLRKVTEGMDGVDTIVNSPSSTAT